MGYKAKETAHSVTKRAAGASYGPKEDANENRGKVGCRNRRPARRQELDKPIQAPDWLKNIREASARRGTDKLTMRKIDTIIADTRRETRNRAR